MSSINKTFRDTMFFVGGVVVALCIENIVYKIHEYIDPNFNDYSDVVYIGLFQILINAFIINLSSQYIESTGLFTFGLLSTQTFIIREGYRSAKSNYHQIIQQRENYDKSYDKSKDKGLFPREYVK